MTTRNGKLLLVATLAALSVSAGALASDRRPAAAGRAPAASAPEVAPDAASCTEAPKPAPRRQREVEGCTESPPPPQLRSKLFHQLRYHSSFPATRAQLLAAFSATSELTAAELAWVTDHLPAATFTSAAATLTRLYPEAPAHLVARLAGTPALATVATR
jgi:hypothetical protein